MSQNEWLRVLTELSVEERLNYWESLAHKLTIACRGIWSDEDASAEEKVSGMKAINEILHRVVARISVERKQLYEWRDEDLLGLIIDWAETSLLCKGHVGWALQSSLPVGEGNNEGGVPPASSG